MPLSEDDIREILRLIDESDVEELRVETGDLSLHVVRGDAGPPADDPARRVATVSLSPASDGFTPPREPAPAPAVTAAPPVAGAASGDLLTIPAPMLGTFYRAPAPGAAPFVDVGTRVEAGTVVCLIEVMKMMNSVPAGTAGTVVEVCAENGELVEQGAPLFRVQADP
jgi:acetyl-CoA carboxylase biotin carboxyl carrier protein